MHTVITSVLWELGRTTLLLAVVGLAAALILRLARVRSPLVHRLACLVTLLVGWTFVRVPLEVPWYPAPAPLPPAITVPRHLPSPSIVVVPEGNMPYTPPRHLTDDPDVHIVVAQPIRQPAPQKQTRSPLAWHKILPPALVAIWLAGIAFVVLWWIASYLRFVWRLPPGLPVEQAWLDEWTALQAKEHVRPIPLRITADLGPLVCRLPRGTELLVPLSVWQQLNSAERRAVLAHELAHHLRGDLWRSLAVRVLALPHWFNPVAWLAVRRFDEAAEWACDRAATGESAVDYAKILLRLSELASRSAPFSSAMSNVPLTSRIKRIITRDGADSALKRALILALLLVTLPLAAVQIRLVAQEAAPAQKQPLPPPAGESKPVVPPAANTTDQPQAEPTALQAAHQKMIEAAKEAYAAAERMELKHQANLERRFTWSSRWLAAELAAATNHQQRVAAARAHLERMKIPQAEVRRLRDKKVLGYELDQQATTDYFVADAQRRLAEIEAGEDTVSLLRTPQAATLLQPGIPAPDPPKPFTLGGKLYAADDPKLTPALHQVLSNHFFGSVDNTQMIEALNILAFREIRVEQKTGKLLAPEPELIEDLIELLDYQDEAIMTAAFNRLQRFRPYIEDQLKHAVDSSNPNIAKRARWLLDAPPLTPVSAAARTAPQQPPIIPLTAPQAVSGPPIAFKPAAESPAAQISVQLNGMSYRLFDPELIPAIETALKSDNEFQQMTALMAAGMIESNRPAKDEPPFNQSESNQVVRKIVELLDYTNPRIRDYAAQVLLGMRDSIEDELKTAADSPNQEIAGRARTLLSQVSPAPINVTAPAPHGDFPSSPFIPTVRLRDQTFALNDPALVTTLREVLGNRDDRELLAALSIAGFSYQSGDELRIGPQTELVDAMIALLDHPEILVRDWAANTLLVMRPQIEPQLQQAAKSSNPAIAEQASSLLKRPPFAPIGSTSSVVQGVGVNSNAGLVGTLTPETSPLQSAARDATQPRAAQALSARQSKQPAPRPAAFADPYATPSSRPARPPAATRPATPTLARPSHLYEGKTIDEWIGVLQTDLSPARRTEALEALGEFAGNGYGQRVVEVVFPLMNRISTWSLDSKFKEAAIRAISMAPANERLPAIRAALASGNDNERLFALQVLPLDDKDESLLPLLLPAVQDSNWHVAAMAAVTLATYDHDNPAVIDYLRKALNSTEHDQVRHAVRFISQRIIGPPPLPNYPQLTSELLSLINSPDAEISQLAHDSLFNQGELVLDELERIMSQGGPQSDAARKLWDEINAKLPASHPNKIDRRR